MSTYVVTVTVVLFTTISLTFQILPLITVPLTGDLALSCYNGFEFGVYGWCTTQTNGTTLCMQPQIGYIDVNDETTGLNIRLPSRLKFSFTKLLIVHPLSVMITFIMWIMVLLILFARFRTSPRYLLVVALYSAPAFLCCLLAFLVDILLYVSHLSWVGWLVLASTVMMAVCCSLLWTLRRSASTKKYQSLYSEDRVSSIESYSLPDFKVQTNSLHNEENQDTGPMLLLEPESTYRGSID